MTAEEIITLTRKQLDDTAQPYLWDDLELVAYLNNAINEFVTETRWFQDATTEAICQVKVLSNLGFYALDYRVTQVLSATPVSCTTPLTMKTATWMNRYMTNWPSVYGTNLEYIVPLSENSSQQTIQLVPKYYDGTGYVTGSISYAAADSSINMAGGTFTSHYLPGEEISVEGTASNDGFFTISTVTNTKIVVTGTIVDEGAISSTLRRVDDTLNLRVVRLPLNQIDVSNLSVTPEIPLKYHLGLIDGIKREAYEKDDADTLNIGKADRARAKFSKVIADGKRDVIRRYHVDGAIDVHRGAI